MGDLSSNFLLFAMNHYRNSHCNIEEFQEDVKRFLYLKKLFTRYRKNNDLQERLILNHIIVLYNCFEESATDMLFFKTNKEHWGILATFLTFLNRMPERIKGINASDIKLDVKLIDILRKI